MTENYLIRIRRVIEVEVIASSSKEAQQLVKEMYLNGDACTDLEDATFGVVGMEVLDEEGDILGFSKETNALLNRLNVNRQKSSR